eukprot:s5501_g5.t1
MVAVIGRCLVVWLLVGLAVAELRHGGRSLKEKDKDDKKKKQQAVKQLKEQVAQLTQEKNTLSEEVKSNARDASAKARQIAELTAQVSQQQSTIASLRVEVAKKQPSAAAGNAEMEAKRLEKLTAEASRQQQEIASLTSQLSALKIKHETLQQEYGDPSLRYFLASKATKVYGDPGIQGAANKTFKYVLPHIAEALKTSTEVYAALNESLLDSMHSILGSETSFEPMLPTMSAFLVYGMICCPVGLMLSYALEWVCKLRELLLATSFYLFSLSALAAGFVAITQRDPLKELYEHDSSVFVLQQSGFFVILVVQLLLIAIALCGAASADDVPVQAGVSKITKHLRSHVSHDDDGDGDGDDGDDCNVAVVVLVTVATVIVVVAFVVVGTRPRVRCRGRCRRARLVFRTRRRLGHRGLRFRRAGQRVQSQYGVYLGTAPRHIWVQSLSGTRLLCYGCRATATALPVVFVTVLLLTASGSARSDGSRALTTNHPYGPSLVVRNYLVWDATRRELWETALLSTTRRLPVREY